MSSETEADSDQKDLIAIANIQIRVEAIVTAVIQARTGIAELHTFLGDCGYGDNLTNLRVMERCLSNMAQALTRIRDEY